MSAKIGIIVGVLFLAFARFVPAQQPGQVPLIGFLSSLASPSPLVEAFREGLRELGYVEGKKSISSTDMEQADVSGFPALRLNWCG
jgi:putative ABC transport system substrate-binding protein